MNTFTDWQCYTLGKRIVGGHENAPAYGKPWADLLKDSEFQEFRTRRGITDKQISLIKKGFLGHDFPNWDKKEIITEGVMPFGIHKDKYFSQVPDTYWTFLNTQPWLSKWPAVALHVRNIMADIKENSASEEEINTILQKIS